MSKTTGEVREYWNGFPCQSDLSTEENRKKYFEEISYKRYHGREWHVPIIAKFEEFKGKKVLEIGCGFATDGLEFAKNGAIYTGVDLTPNGIMMAKERFKLFNVEGNFEVADAQKSLPFPDNTFDHIYSFGVIMASPSPESIVEQMYRVLKPGGTFNVMLYNRSSINYYIEIKFLRKLFRPILYPKFMPALLAKITGFAEWKLQEHRKILVEKGKLSEKEWLNINTDGPLCPLIEVYNKKEAAELFKKFDDVRQEVWEFNSEHWAFLGKLLPTKLERAIGRVWGWHRMIYGTKKR